MAVFEDSRGTYELVRRGERPQAEFTRRLTVIAATRITAELADEPTAGRRIRNLLAQVMRRTNDSEPFERTLERALHSGALSLHKRVPMVSPADFLPIVHAVATPRAAAPVAVAERAAAAAPARAVEPAAAAPGFSPALERAAAAQATAFQQAAETGTPLVHKCLDCPACRGEAA